MQHLLEGIWKTSRKNHYHRKKKKWQEKQIKRSFERTFLCLEHFDFNESFITLVKTIHRDVQTFVMNNGCVTENFKTPRGFRQGCTLSA